MKYKLIIFFNLVYISFLELKLSIIVVEVVEVAETVCYTGMKN